MTPKRCALCDEPLRHLQYRTTIAGGSRVVRLTDPTRLRGAMHKACAEQRRDELNLQDRTYDS